MYWNNSREECSKQVQCRFEWELDWNTTHFQRSITQYSTVKCSTARHSAVHYSIVHYRAVQYSTAQHGTARHGTAHRSTSLPTHRLTLRAIYDTEGLRIARIPVWDLVVWAAGYVLTFICCISVHACEYVRVCVYCNGLRTQVERHIFFLFEAELQ